jgi:type VI secretion system protein ImpM
MTHPVFNLPRNSEVPGWYGKLPGMGDFAQRRLPGRFVSIWDRWLQHGFEHLRGARADWAQSYLESHVWFFALGPSVIGPKPWMGLLVPSVDSVGRYFPLTVAIELNEAIAPSEVLAADTGADDASSFLLSTCARVALDALENDLDAERFDQSLEAAFKHWAINDRSNHEVAIVMPKAARSTWHTGANFHQSQGFSVGGMPGNSEFSLLFASADDASFALSELSK